MHQEVISGDGECQVPVPVRCPQSLTHCFDLSDAALLVGNMVGPLALGGRAFSDVVYECRETYTSVVAECRSCVERHQHVGPNVSFGVVISRLRDTKQGIEFW